MVDMKMMKKIEESSFYDRFLGFIEKYDQVFNTHYIDQSNEYVKNKDPYLILTILRKIPNLDKSYINFFDLYYMTDLEFCATKDYLAQILPLANERKTLCSELCTYLGAPC